jgi:hypothetical protein
MLPAGGGGAGDGEPAQAVKHRLSRSVIIANMSSQPWIFALLHPRGTAVGAPGSVDAYNLVDGKLVARGALSTAHEITIGAGEECVLTPMPEKRANRPDFDRLFYLKDVRARKVFFRLFRAGAAEAGPRVSFQNGAEALLHSRLFTLDATPGAGSLLEIKLGRVN